MALIMVLLLLSLTVGLCYAAMRSQYTAAAIHRNAGQSASAYRAALVGMTMAVKKIHSNGWAGVGTSFGGPLGPGESFTAAFTAGDSNLDTNDPDQPYRLTILSTGRAVDPSRPESSATYKIRLVLRLVPRMLAAQPSDWAEMQKYTVYQTKRHDVEIDIPCRFAGKVRLQKKLLLAPHYPNTSESRARYMADLKEMMSHGWPDYRTFSGPVHLPFGDQESKYMTLLTSKLGAAAEDTPSAEAASDWVKPASPGSYRIYQGGPEYAIQTAPASLNNTRLQPDVQTNPLGLFYRDGSISLYSNVTIQGTLFCKNEIHFRGSDVALAPVDLPPLAGTAAPVRLATTGSQEATVEDGSSGTVKGVVAVFDDFRVQDGSDATAFALSGKLIAARLYVEERSSWNSTLWSLFYDWFIYLLNNDPQTAVKYFPEFMTPYGYNPVPRLVFAPETAEAVYHWSNSYDPIFVPHPDDGGLCWDFLTWTEEK